jgi:hypothetical protein
VPKDSHKILSFKFRLISYLWYDIHRWHVSLLGNFMEFHDFSLGGLTEPPSLPRLSVSERNNEVFDICRASWPPTSGYEEHPSISISFRSA